MGKGAFSLAAVLCLAYSVCTTAENNPSTIPLEQIHTGMEGTAYTVFQGTKPEPMEVEVLGVLHNVNGPKGDIILVRLHGTKPEYTGVAPAMTPTPAPFAAKLPAQLPSPIP